MYLFVSHSISLLDKIVHLCFFNKIVFPLIKRTGHVKNHAVPLETSNRRQTCHITYPIYYLETLPSKLPKTWWELPGHSGTSLTTLRTCHQVGSFSSSSSTLSVIRDSIVFYYLILLPYI